MIKSQGWNGPYFLANFADKPVELPLAVVGRDNTTLEVIGGRAPHKENSSGRVYVRNPVSKAQHEVFPHVYNLKWVKL